MIYLKKNTSNKRNKDCCICEEIRTGLFPESLSNVYGIQKRVCIETEKFVVWPSVSPLTQGHTLLFPKRHITSLALLNSDEQKQFLKIVDLIIQRITKCFSWPFVFEHGMSQTGQGGCGITHAHLHFIPIDKMTIRKVKQCVLNDHPSFVHTNLGGLFNFVPNSEYLFLGDDPSKMNLFTNFKRPSQYLRKLIVKIQKQDNWDWRKLFGVNDFRATWQALNSFDSKR